MLVERRGEREREGGREGGGEGGRRERREGEYEGERRGEEETHLMCTAYKIEVMFVKKFTYNVCSKCKRDAPVVFGPSSELLVWICPQQITQKALVRHVCGPHDASNLLCGLEVWGESYVEEERSFICFKRSTNLKDKRL